ncbi:hypothetical protein Emag_000328 [Eimeria magna]
MAGLHPAAKRAGSMPRMEAPSRSFQQGAASLPVHSKTAVHGFSHQPTNLSFKDSRWLPLRPPSALPGPVTGSWEQQAPLKAQTFATAVAEGQQPQLDAEGSLILPSGSSGPSPSLLHLPSGEVGGFCGLGGSAPPRQVIPGNLHALIPSKFKYKFPRERIPRHKSYEVLAVEDNPYGPPPLLAPPPPKKPHKKKSIFGIAKRVQQQPTLHARSRYFANAAAAPASMNGAMVHEPVAEAAGEAAAEGQRGWVCDLKCFLCTSPDFVSEEQITLERENAQLDEALAEFQDATRVQAIELLETKKMYEDRLRDNMRANQEAANDVAATKAALQEIQAERDRLLEIQRQTEESLFLIRQRMGAGLDALYHSQSKRSEELVEKMKHFCLGVTELLDKALPADKAGDKGLGVAITPEVLGTPPGSPRLAPKKPSAKKKKGKKRVLKKKTKKTAAGGSPKTKGRRTKVKRQRMHRNTGLAASAKASPEQQLSPAAAAAVAAAAAATAAALHATTTKEKVANTRLQAPSLPLALPLQPPGNSGQGQGKEVVLLRPSAAPAPAAATAAPAAAAAPGLGKLELVLYPGISEKTIRASNAQQQDEASLLLKQRLIAFNQQQQQQQQQREGIKKLPLRRSVSADRKVAAASPSLIRRASLRSPSGSFKTLVNSSSNSSMTKHAAAAAAGTPKRTGKEVAIRAAANPPQQKGEAAAAAAGGAAAGGAAGEEGEAAASPPLGLHASSAAFEEVYVPAGGKSLGRLWTLKAPPPLPPGLVAKLREHADIQSQLPLIMRGITTPVEDA